VWQQLSAMADKYLFAGPAGETLAAVDC
jgi:hypothetical protein